MLNNIFLLKGKNSKNFNHLDIYSYPEDLAKHKHKEFIAKIVAGHEHFEYLDKNLSVHNPIGTSSLGLNSIGTFTFSSPVYQKIHQSIIYTICINSTMLIGLIFDKEDNPLDYKSIFQDLANDLLNAEKCCFFEDEIEIENFLITLFIDIRRYGDEILGQYSKVSVPPAGISTKVFLFGIDNVGKSSLVRRIKTGEFNDNFFPPSRKFNIEYIQKPEGIFSFWDMAGQSIFREKWLKGIQDSNIIIYMIDVANQIRFEEAKREFWNFFDKYNLLDTPLLILGNKVDLIKEIFHLDSEDIKRISDEVIQFFEFNELKDINWKFILTSVKTNYNLDYVLDMVYNYG